MKIRYVEHKAFNNKGQVVASCLQAPAGICGFLLNRADNAVTHRYQYKRPDFGYYVNHDTLSEWKLWVRRYGAVRFQKVIVEREV